MTTCIGIQNKKGYVLATDGRIAAQRKIGTDSQNKIIQVTEEVKVAFSGTFFLFSKLQFFLQGLDDSVSIVKESSYSKLNESSTEYAELCVDKFLGLPIDSTETRACFAANEDESKIAIRVIWEYFINWLDESGDFLSVLEPDTKLEYEFLLLFATPIGIFETTMDGYISCSSYAVIGGDVALGSVLTQLTGYDSVSDLGQDVDDTVSTDRFDIHELSEICKRALAVSSLVDNSTGSKTFIETHVNKEE